MKKQKIYYKIVKNNSNLTSFASHDYRVTYNIAQWTKPHSALPGSKLFVFDSCKAAKDFMITQSVYDNNNYVIYTCEVINPRKLQVISVLWGSNIKNIWKLWKNKKGYKNNDTVHTRSIPTGTIHADAVKLIKKVI